MIPNINFRSRTSTPNDQFPLINFSLHQKMHLKLDAVRVTATSDGGLSFKPDPAQGCMYPVFSVEVTTYSHCRYSSFAGEAKKARPTQQRSNISNACRSNIRRNARPSLSPRFLRRIPNVPRGCDPPPKPPQHPPAILKFN